MALHWLLREVELSSLRGYRVPNIVAKRMKKEILLVCPCSLSFGLQKGNLENKVKEEEKERVKARELSEEFFYALLARHLHSWL